MSRFVKKARGTKDNNLFNKVCYEYKEVSAEDIIDLKELYKDKNILEIVKKSNGNTQIYVDNDIKVIEIIKEDIIEEKVEKKVIKKTKKKTRKKMKK